MEDLLSQAKREEEFKERLEAEAAATTKIKEEAEAKKPVEARIDDECSTTSSIRAKVHPFLWEDDEKKNDPTNILMAMIFVFEFYFGVMFLYTMPNKEDEAAIEHVGLVLTTLELNDMEDLLSQAEREEEFKERLEAEVAATKIKEEA
ncbi:hypothetical protein TSUD_114980 [Trifolium subterraneum]|uniref:Uncharacterized protein n=1 Tax=Trifolium subterraneum TaxID=3900 RepID=A0A2Z6P8N3_TRISU|nr:hypothetical protein TSUD_114980 [Trifolium subterraneum]